MATNIDRIKSMEAAALKKFGIPILFGATSITAIFDQKFMPVNAFGELVNTEETYIICNRADISSSVSGSQFTILGVVYTGHGMEDYNYSQVKTKLTRNTV